MKSKQQRQEKLKIGIKCDSCGKCFAFKHNLKRHIDSTHLAIKPHKCENCDQSFDRKDSLQSHIRFVHKNHKRNSKSTKQKYNFICELCAKRFTQKCVLQRHSNSAQ